MVLNKFWYNFCIKEIFKKGTDMEIFIILGIIAFIGITYTLGHNEYLKSKKDKKSY